MTGHTKRPRKSVDVSQSVSGGEPRKRSVQGRGVIGLIKGVPCIRVVDLLGIKVTFVPHAGTYWISQDDIEKAVGLDIGPAEIFATQYPEWHDLPGCRVIEVQERIFEIGGYYSLRSAFLAVRYSYVRDEKVMSRARSFCSTLSALPMCAINNKKIPSVDGGRLRMILDKHPHWIDALKLWNEGNTEGQIASALSLRVTTVRSAVIQLRQHGFDVLPNALRREMKRLK